LAKSRCNASEHGFSLIEAVVATSLLAVGVASLAQLFVISVNANRSAKTTTFASVLAQQKMEQLRGLTWGFDVIGLPVSDTDSDTTVVPALPNGGTGLTPSPQNVLRNNTAGYVDYLDEQGQSLGGGAVPPANTVFIRRWSIEPLPTNPNNTLILQVLVTRLNTRGNDNSTEVRRLPDEGRVISVKTRKAS
jgi:type II secretory pathway pseudopilin PulG